MRFAGREMLAETHQDHIGGVGPGEPGERHRGGVDEFRGGVGAPQASTRPAASRLSITSVVVSGIRPSATSAGRGSGP